MSFKNIIVRNYISNKCFNFPYKGLEISGIDLCKLINPLINLKIYRYDTLYQLTDFANVFNIECFLCSDCSSG